MKKVVAIFASLFLAAFLTAYLVTISSAGTPSQTGDSSGRLHMGEPLGAEDVSAVPGDVASDQANRVPQAPDGSVHVMVELEGAPAAEAYASALARGQEAQAVVAVQARLEQIDAAQAALLPALEALDATVLYRLQRVYNGIALTVDVAALDEIGKLEGVAAVRPLPVHQLEHATSVPLIGAPELWDPAGGGLTGDGISIGIIDTGIDYLHADFGGQGAITPSLYDDNDPTVIGDVPGFPSAKVVGGYDFAGDNYDADGDVGSPIPQPDPDPMDCNGHGTHVAGTAAGMGVNADGTTYTGPYSSGIPFLDFEIAPGVAPEAELYALKVFGCDGTSLVVPMAIEWAIDPNGDGDFTDRLDVINMSLGSTYGGNDEPSTVASNNAAAAGIIVVAASGNADDVYYVTDSPGSGDRVLSVASSIDSGARLAAFVVHEPPSLEGLHPASEALFGPDLADTGPVSGTLVLADDGIGVVTDACTPLDNAAEVDGNIALIDRGGCTFVEKVDHAQDAGAIGVLIANNISDADPITMGGDDPTITIPSMMTTFEVGEALKAALPGVVVELTAAYRGEFFLNIPARTDTLSDFSSRGPRRDSFLKPDIAAPGQTIFSAAAGSGNEGTSSNGTSMATPHVSGVMTLLREMHPLWTVEELKALAMNTAWHDLRQTVELDSLEYGPGRVGAGRIDAEIAGHSEVVAYGTGRPGMVSVNFGEVEVISETLATRVVRVVNRGNSSVTYDVSYDSRVDIPGVAYAVSPDTVTVDPNDFAEVMVTMTADASAMRNAHDPTVAENVLGLLRYWINEEAGYLQLLPSQMVFSADLSGGNEVPPVTTDATDTAVMTYTVSTGELAYTLDVDNIVDATAAHIHTGLPGVNGGVIHWLYDASGTNAPDGPFPVSGSVTLLPKELSMLLSGALYVNVHTSANPGGEVRGQLELDGQAPLRVPVYVTARPAAEMEAVQETVDVTGSSVISLTGNDINTGMDFPTDTVSLVSALELQYLSGDDPESSGAANMADIQAIGVASDIAATGMISETWLFFGLASHGEWASPNEMFFDIYIDSDQDGTPDYVAFNWNLAFLGFSADTMASVLVDLSTGSAVVGDYLNGVPPNVPTYLFNNNVMVVPVPAADMGLTDADSSFDYYVVASYRDEVVDMSGMMTYDAANPGLDFSGGVPGAPVWLDLDGATIEVEADHDAFAANNSLGALLLHHHNKFGQRVEVLMGDAVTVHLPLIFQH